MKLSKAILAAVSVSAEIVEPTTSEIISHGCQGATPNALFAGSTFQSCISEIDCDTMTGYHIFNHFHDDYEAMTLVPECRLISARPMPGFTCGSDPTLRTDTKIVVPSIPTTGYVDHRSMTILKSGRYTSLEAAMEGQSTCPDHATAEECPFIQQFYDGCPSTEIRDGLVIFTNPFNQTDCEPKIIDHKENDSWVEEHKIYLGYDDLVTTLPGDLQVRTDIHKIYEISCKISKMGEVGTDVEVHLLTDNEDFEDSIDTNFYIKKYFGDITDISSRYELDETDVIPFSPNADPNDRFQFEIGSDHEKEYVHLESCKLTLDGNNDFEQEFINDGCVTDDWEKFFANDARIEKINQDWFNMRPLLIGCKSKWHIDCTVASCKRGLASTNYPAYEKFCKADDKCEERYTAEFLSTSARKRRSTHVAENNTENPAEDHVKMDLVHPCYFVDDQTTEYCVDKDTCWTLEQCAAMFPDDFSKSDKPSLDDIVRKFQIAIQKHINDALATTESPVDAHDQIMETLRDHAQQVDEAKKTFDEAIEAIIASINNL